MESTNFLSVDIVCIAIGFCAALYSSVALTLKVRKIRKKSAEDNVKETSPIGGLPNLSVIVYAPGWNPQLKPLIHEIFSQEYPSDFEVIVVNAEKDSKTEDEISELQLSYSNLYLTFSPEKPKNLSPKKLALTIGIKAARYDYVILTQSNVNVASGRWLESMARNFADGKDLVTGYARYEENRGNRLTRMQAFDFVRESIRWLSSNLSGKTIRGSGYNIGYRKELFFANKGFSRHLDLMDGDDDIFIYEAGKDVETGVELSDASIVNVKNRAQKKEYRLSRMSREFTSDYIPRRSKRAWGSVTLCGWVCLVASVIAVIFCQNRIYVPIASGVIVAWFMGMVMLNYRSVCRSLNLRRSFLSAPVMLLLHPFYWIWVRLKTRKNRTSFHAWGVYRPI